MPVFQGHGTCSPLPRQSQPRSALAEAAWQPELKDRLRSLAKDYEEIAEDIETGATEIRHPELLER